MKRKKEPLIVPCGEVRCYYAGKCICPPEHVEPENRATQELPAVPDAQLMPKTWTAGQERDAIIEYLRRIENPWASGNSKELIKKIRQAIAHGEHIA